MRTLLLVDGSNLAHKCAHVFSLTDGAGDDVSILFGFTKTLYTYLEKFDPASVIVAWDRGKPRHRMERTNGEYKAHRERDVDYYNDYIRQVKLLDDYMLPAMGVLSLSGWGIEADDYIHHAAVLSNGYDRIIIISSDRDLYQTVGFMSNVYMYDSFKQTLKGMDFFVELNILPDQYVHWRALQGDPSDNIVGVKGIGEKTATKLFNEFGSLSGIWNAVIGSNPEKVLTGKVADAIKAFGWQRLVDNVYVMALYVDRTGARLSLVRSLDLYQRIDVKALKKLLFKYSFVSLMDGDFYNACKRLGPPEFNVHNKCPVICQKRRALE